MKVRYILYIICVILSVTSCVEPKKETVSLPAVSNEDSLKQVIADRDAQIEDIITTINEIQAGFNEISDAEDRVTILQNDERSDKTEQIKESINIIADRMQQNRELIKKLRQQLRDSNFKSNEFKRTLSNMLKQMDDKDVQLQRMQTELDAKDIHIAELDKTISDLNLSVEALKTESEGKSATIDNQITLMNTAWYVFGTKRELKGQRILANDRVLQQDFNKNYFTKIDIRVTDEIKLYSKSATILTSHPIGSYDLRQDNNKQYVLHITKPQLFWSMSKYLVILVK